MHIKCWFLPIIFCHFLKNLFILFSFIFFLLEWTEPIEMWKPPVDCECEQDQHQNVSCENWNLFWTEVCDEKGRIIPTNWKCFEMKLDRWLLFDKMEITDFDKSRMASSMVGGWVAKWVVASVYALKIGSAWYKHITTVTTIPTTFIKCPIDKFPNHLSSDWSFFL